MVPETRSAAAAGRCLPVFGTVSILARMTMVGNAALRGFGAAGGVVPRPCAAEGCEEPGEYPAPRSRAALRERIWLCLEHIRAHNSAWDYCAGMSEADIEAQIRADVTWRRPTWPMGAREAGGRIRVRDPFGLFEGARGAEPPSPPPSPPASPEERRALAALDLKPPASLETIKARYKMLVKSLHPDANGGGGEAEERLKSVNQAYNTLTAGRPL